MNAIDQTKSIPARITDLQVQGNAALTRMWKAEHYRMGAGEKGAALRDLSAYRSALDALIKHIENVNGTGAEKGHPA